MSRLESREDDASGHGSVGEVELDIIMHTSQRAKVRREADANRHVSVCTSTDTTGGRFCAIAVQVSPALADA
jgi:hypothetical protein